MYPPCTFYDSYQYLVLFLTTLDINTRYFLTMLYSVAKVLHHPTQQQKQCFMQYLISVLMYLRFPPLPVIRYISCAQDTFASNPQTKKPEPYHTQKNVVIYCSFSTHMPHGQSISIGKSQVTGATTRCTNFVPTRKLPAISLKLIDPN